jgi:hypothetical protein
MSSKLPLLSMDIFGRGCQIDGFKGGWSKWPNSDHVYSDDGSKLHKRVRFIRINMKARGRIENDPDPIWNVFCIQDKIIYLFCERSLFWNFFPDSNSPLSFYAFSHMDICCPAGLYCASLTLNINSFAGALTGAITTPLDVIKTRLMVQVWPICFLLILLLLLIFFI